MGKLIYSATASIDGYIADVDGKFDFTEPDAEVHTFINDFIRPVGTFLLGRRMYEVLTYWEDPPGLGEQPAYTQDFAEIWRAADKIVYSKTLETAATARTSIERRFDPELVRQLKARSERSISIGGPELAAHAIGSGLVDEYGLFFAPIVLGSGKRYFPRDVRLDLELLEQRRFGSGTAFLHYGTR